MKLYTATRLKHLIQASLFALAASNVSRADPTVLVQSGVDDYALSDPWAYWRSAADCIIFEGDPIDTKDPEAIRRKDADGGAAHTLFYENDPRPAWECNPYKVLSEIIADDQFVYWIDASGLVRLPVDASQGEPVELLAAGVKTDETGPTAELDQDDDFIYAITFSDVARGNVLRSIRKSDGAVDILASVGSKAHDLQHDGKYLFWVSLGELKRLAFFHGQASVATIAEGVTGYHAEGPRPVGHGATSRYVFCGQGNNIYRLSLDDLGNVGSTRHMYSNLIQDLRVYSLTSDANDLFYFEVDPQWCDAEDCLFPEQEQTLVRIPRNADYQDPGYEPLYTRMSATPGQIDALDLRSIGGVLYWREQDRLMRFCPDCRYVRGDANADFRIDLSDASFILNFLFLGGREPRCMDTANANGDPKVDLSDASYLLNHLFLGGPGPYPKDPQCGEERM